MRDIDPLAAIPNGGGEWLCALRGRFEFNRFADNPGPRPRNGAQKIQEWVKDQKRGASQRVQAEVERIIDGYFGHPPQQFQYASLARFGLHQGSGVTEGACKSLITMRAKRSGQRWRRVGITSALAIRSLLESDRLPAFWKHLKRRFVAPLKIAA